MNKQNNSFYIDFSGEKSIEVSKEAFDYIGQLEYLIKNPEVLPGFYNLAEIIDNYEESLIEFYSYIYRNHKQSKSQLFQDLFVLFILDNKREGRFLEFGATNGLDLSNSSLLESDYQWNGVLAEPSPQWKDQLKVNRPKSTILDKCIYSSSGQEVDFFVSNVGILSTIVEFKNSDIGSMPANARTRNANGYNVTIPTISLNDVFIQYFDGEPIEYMSVDTEGSELLILESFDFDKYGPKVVTVEHNFTPAQNKLDSLFEVNGYHRYFKDQSQFDAWYVKN